MQTRRIRAGIAAAALLATLVSCGKDEQEAAKFERADHETFVRDMSDLSSFTLANGITVYLQEERTNEQIAIEVLYRAGFLDEPKGRAQLSHVAEHLAVHCATAGFAAEESIKKMTDGGGMVNAEAVSDFSHIDYIANAATLDMALSIEAQRITSLACDEDVRTTEIAKVIKEIDDVVSNPKGSLAKYGMMALHQALHHGERFVPIRAGATRITIAQSEQFVRDHYRPDDAVIVIVGNVKKAEAEALVRKHFEAIPRRPQPAPLPKAAAGNIRATWDVEGQALYFVSPGPYESFRDRLILTMFGSYLHQVLMTSEEVYGPCRSVYASNQIYRVDEIPFFVFAEPAQGRTIEEIKPTVRRYIDAAVASLDDSRIQSIAGSLVSFATATSLKKNVPDYPLMHHQVIGQEAL
ncbi:MAG TPA: insulinase family protein, partial [Candidatus Krumholzibacteria bacterium]|nr:insulinase family protein [Candidatus Krumholzibacteria bacterium]